MNFIINSILLSFVFTIVVCDRNADIQCLKNGAKSLSDQTDQQLIDITQQNLQIGEQMVLKRATIADDNGLICYKQFYDNYTKGLEQIFMDDQETKRLDTALTPGQRSDAVKAIAGITQTMRCDEDWRAVHFNETVKEAECSALERLPYAMDLFHFRPKLALLETGLSLAQMAAKLKNNVMSGIVGEISQMYSQLYSKAETCSRQLSLPEDRCRNLKMFVLELDRLYYLLGIQIQANIF